jgi:hypothetical protein
MTAVRSKGIMIAAVFLLAAAPAWAVSISPGTPITATSGNVAAATATATLAAVSNQTTYITGFEITGTGAAAGLPVICTVTGVVGGPLSYIYAAAAGVLVENTPLIVEYVEPIPATAVNVAIVVSCPTLGSGNTNNAVTAHGFQN